MSFQKFTDREESKEPIVSSPWIQGGMDFGAKIKYGGERNFFGARKGTNLGGGKGFC